MAVLILALTGYLFLVDLGINAGRVHKGVAIEGLDVGGRTFAETYELLKERGKELQREPVVFGAEGFDCRFTPKEIGWGPQPYDTAQAAMSIGRPLGSWSSIEERFQAWTDGVEMPWAGSADADRIDKLIDGCERHARALGLTIDRVNLKAGIEQAIVTWPRPIAFPVPFIS